MKGVRRLLASVTIIGGLTTFASSLLAQALVPPQADSFPQSYGEWAGRWSQYTIGIPAAENPIADPTGAQCQVGQWGPVFFLVGTGGGRATRSCDVPADVGLFFPIIEILCAIPDDGNTPAEVVKACSPAIDAVARKSLSLTIDSKSVQNLTDNRASQFFSFTGAIPGFAATSCTGVPNHCYEGFRNIGFTDGYWAMLNPLQPGQHTVRFKAEIPKAFSLDVTYHLNAVPR